MCYFFHISVLLFPWLNNNACYLTKCQVEMFSWNVGSMRSWSEHPSFRACCPDKMEIALCNFCLLTTGWWWLLRKRGCCRQPSLEGREGRNHCREDMEAALLCLSCVSRSFLHCDFVIFFLKKCSLKPTLEWEWPEFKSWPWHLLPSCTH